MLPADADPMDVRYNMINWVHRSTRGWSYGGGVTDPRTGEIIKGNVTLGSLRIRQDILIGTGLMAPYAGLDPDDAPDLTDLVPDATEDDVAKMSLARIRQLAAHEVGHTLGLEHNFAASTYGRASVMDYPAPYVKIADGALDLSEAYAKGLGAYDFWAIQWGYGADDRTANAVAEDGVSRGLRFVDDDDSRSPRSGHPLGSLWDNGPDAVAELKRVMAVRQIALSRFGLHNLPIGAPVSTLEVRLLPLYLLHRYQIAAAAKWIGGADFTYAIRTATGTSPAMPFQIVPAERQREALAALLTTLDPSVLDAAAVAARDASADGIRLRRRPLGTLRQPRDAVLRSARRREHRGRSHGVGAAAARARGPAGGLPCARSEEPGLHRCRQRAGSEDVYGRHAGAPGRPGAPPDDSISRRHAVDCACFECRRLICRAGRCASWPSCRACRAADGRRCDWHRASRRHPALPRAPGNAGAADAAIADTARRADRLRPYFFSSGHCRRRRGRLGVVEDEDFLARRHVAEVAAGRFLDRRRVLAEATSLGLQPLVLSRERDRGRSRAPRTRGGPASSPTGRLRRRATRRRASAPQARGRSGSGG